MHNADVWGLISLLFDFIGTIFIPENDILNKDKAKTVLVFL